ncbi:MAG: FecCD family ABC transporter permease [Hyphomonadaceae bacterium]
MKLSALLVVALLALLIAHALFGPAGLAVRDAMRALAGGGEESAREIVWAIRVPRALCAALVGASLGLCGAALQGLLRNPLADAGVLGVSGFASLGAVVAFAYGLTELWAWSPQALAILFALAAAALVVSVGVALEGVSALILIGVGVSSLAGALIALALNMAPSLMTLADLVNWTLGSVANRSFDDLALAAPIVAAGAALISSSGRALTALGLGDETARTLGVNVAAARTRIIAGVALAAGAATALAGIIGFVGVAAPHLVRASVGHDPARTLLPATLMGACLVAFADLCVRLSPFDQPLALGVAAAFLGAPIFILAAARLARSAR